MSQSRAMYNQFIATSINDLLGEPKLSHIILSAKFRTYVAQNQVPTFYLVENNIKNALKKSSMYIFKLDSGLHNLNFWKW